ncbi:hypothetical protein ACA910_000607 [Epithemia clementina (nom. ined.)]
MDDDEPECRVCRGPAEEDHPLYKPCRCSGSIGCTHQDCLQSWLAVNNATKCELCGTPFRFSNQYAPNTPDRLPVVEVLLGFTRNVLATWLPLWLRVSMAAALWLLVAPLATSFIYHGWMHGNMLTTGNSILQMQWNIVVDELVSGAVLVALVLFSFLSLMSLVDFLRAEWNDPMRQQQQREPGPPVARNQVAGGAQPMDNHNNNNRDHGLQRPEIDEADVDIEIYNFFQVIQKRQQQQRKQRAQEEPPMQSDPEMEALVESLVRSNEQQDSVDDADSMRNSAGSDDGASVEFDTGRELGSPGQDSSQGESAGVDNDRDNNDNDENNGERDADDDDAQRELQNFIQEAQRADGEDDEDDENEEDEEADDAVVVDDDNNNNNNNNDGRPNNNDGLDDDPVLDADLNIALDELLGVRGPLWIVVRNLLWLLAFNTLYLAIFAFVPRVIGSMFVSLWAPITLAAEKSSNLTIANNVTLALVNVSTTANETEAAGVNATTESALVNATTTTITNYSLCGIFTAIEQESARLSTTFRLNDFLLVTIGYACAAASIVFMRYLWILARYKSSSNGSNNNAIGGGEDEIREALLREINNNNNAGGMGGIEMHHHGPQHHHHNNNNIDEDGHVAIGVAMDAVLDAAASIVKVGVLLFLKMFLLPVMLGFCLDLSTISLFQRTLDEIILYAGRDLFSFLFLHWVAGISFMLLVTVSVLQLREVAHPSVLAHIIRPQEPQPDLLGNLLHDSLVTHGKRLFLSLVIYVLLLILQIHIPIHMFVSAIGGASSFWKLKFYYLLTPRLQIPIELCIFHLCMLAFLEKNKNSIGELQHYWLKYVCQMMDIGNSIIPHEVEKFRFVGSRPVFSNDYGDYDTDAFWYELAQEQSTKARELMIESKLKSYFFVEAGIDRFTTGETSVNGRRILKSRSEYIRLPTNTPELGSSILIPTTIGRYRLDRGPVPSGDKEQLLTSWPIELWEEVIGASIARPPEGWDDLGVGGADVQGRWAWDREKKSFIEEGVAHRTTLFPRQQPMFRQCIVVAKLALLIVFSWIAATVATSVLLMLPLVVGRFTFALMRLPEKYVHDPFCFAVGSSVVFPVLRRLIAFLKMGDQSLSMRFWTWLRSARAPPFNKAMILLSTGFLWFVFVPFLIGLACDMLFLWSDERFVDQTFDKLEIFPCWAFGTVLLSGLSAGCVAGLLTRDFWMGVFVNEPNRAEGPRDPSAWQGAHGRIARFWDVWKEVIQGWEWDQADLVVLFNNCIFPILRLLFVILFVPLSVWVAPVGWLVTEHSYPLSLLVKTSAAAMFGIHICMSCEREILNWFNSVHQTARDDRYLIGQLLMNHDDQQY